jgi:hypothetical protein
MMPSKEGQRMMIFLVEKIMTTFREAVEQITFTERMGMI